MSPQKSQLCLLFAFVIVVLSACAMSPTATPTAAATWAAEKPAATAAPTERPVELSDGATYPAPQAMPLPLSGGGSALPEVTQRFNRMIIKNAELQLLVADTDIALDRLTQVVGDTGGYIISSRVRYQEWLGVNYKYASVTIGVPVTQFETALRRLRGIAVRVVDESAAGQDVTDEYVDLESRLGNLEATRDRIRTFLDQAKTVEEALRVNEQLAAVEADIEQVKGRMNYLYDRSVYSTINVQLDPELPPLPEPTPTPTPTPVPAWSPAATAREAAQTLGGILRVLADLLIWFTIVLGPFVLPVIVGGWWVWRLRRRK